jgi:hypothetical protein
MKRNFVLTIILGFLIVSYSNIYSQGYLSTHLGAAIPVFNFGNASLDQSGAGGAGVGIDIGAKYTYPIRKDGPNIFVEADIICNGLKKDFKIDLKLLLNNVYGAGSNIKYFSYLNVPIIAGVNYKFLSKKDFDFFGELGIGINLFKKMRLKVESGEIKYKEHYDLSTKMAIKAGVGAIYKNKYSLGINYLILGKQQVKGEQSMYGTSIKFENEDQKVGVLAFTLGYRF